MNELKLNIGSKYQIFSSETDYRIVRSVSQPKKTKLKVLEEDGSISEIDLADDNVFPIESAAVASIFGCKMTNIGVGAGDHYYDVYTVLFKKDNTDIPAMVLRQNILDDSPATIGNYIVVGMNFIGEELIKNPDMQSYIFDEEYDKDGNPTKESEIIIGVGVELYVDDTYENIIKLIKAYDSNILDQLEDIFTKMKPYDSEKNKIVGYCKDLDEFFKYLAFNENYRYIFGVASVDFDIDLGDNIDEDGNVSLNKKQISALEDRFQTYMTNVKCIKYDNDIDIVELIMSPHVMIHDKNFIMYLVTYDVIRKYPSVLKN